MKAIKLIFTVAILLNSVRIAAEFAFTDGRWGTGLFVIGLASFASKTLWEWSDE